LLKPLICSVLFNRLMVSAKCDLIYSLLR